MAAGGRRVHAAPRRNRRRGPAEADRLPLLPGAVPARRPGDRARAARPVALGGRAGAGDGHDAGGGACARPRRSRARRATGGRRNSRRISAALKREVARGEHAGVELRDLLSETAAPARPATGEDGRRRRAARRVPPPGEPLGLRDPRGDRRAPPKALHVIGLTATPPVSLPAGRGRALRRPARTGGLHRSHARRGPRRPPRALPGARLPDRAPTERARVAGRARHPLPRADHHPARRPRVFPAVGDRTAPGRPQALRRRRDRALLGGVPEAQPEAGPGRRAVPGPSRSDYPVSAPHTARPTASRPTSTTGSCCSRTTRCAASRPRERRARPHDQYTAIGAALRELGFNLTRKGIRRGTSEVDRLLTGSQAKAHALVEVLAQEHDKPRRGDARARALRRRARLSAPRRRAHRRPRPRRRHRPPRAAGDRRRRPHRATCAHCWSPGARPALPPAGRRGAAGGAQGHRRGPFQAHRMGRGDRCPAGLAAAPRGAEWMPRAWVELATRLFVEASRACLVGTRALLGEGWNCPAAERAGRHDDRHHRRLECSRCAAARSGWTRRTRRRSPPTGTSCAWRPIWCAGSADYERFVRKHLNLFAPAEDGEVKARPVARAPRARPVLAAAHRALRRPSTAELITARPTARPPASAGRSGRRTAGSSCPPCWCVWPATARNRRSRRRAPRARCISPSACRSRAASAARRRVRRPSASRRARRTLLAGLALDPGRPRLGGRPAARRQAAASADPAARRRRPKRHRRLPRARRAERRRPRARCTIEPRAAGYLRCRADQGHARPRARSSPPRSTSW